MTTRHRFWLYLLPLLLLAGLSGCKVDSANPISPAATARPDSSLYGVWRYREKDEFTFVHIGSEFSLVDDAATAAHQRTRIVIVDHKPNGLTEEAYLAHVSRIGGQRYLNVVQVDDGKSAGYIFVQYALLDRDTLRIATVNEDALKAAIGAGKIKGTIRGDGLASETTITSDAGDIETFLKQDGGKLFGKPVVLKRVPDR